MHLSRSLTALLAVVLTALLTLTPARAHEATQIHEIGLHNDHMLKEGTWVVEFYAVWCGACRNFRPAYETVAQYAPPGVHFGKVNIEGNTPLAAQFGITRLPTIVRISGGQVHTFDGRLAREAVESWVNEDWARGPASSTPYSWVGRLLRLMGYFADFLNGIPAWFKGLTALDILKMLGLFVVSVVVMACISVYRDVREHDRKKQAEGLAKKTDARPAGPPADPAPEKMDLSELRRRAAAGSQ